MEKVIPHLRDLETHHINFFFYILTFFSKTPTSCSGEFRVLIRVSGCRGEEGGGAVAHLGPWKESLVAHLRPWRESRRGLCWRRDPTGVGGRGMCVLGWGLLVKGWVGGWEEIMLGERSSKKYHTIHYKMDKKFMRGGNNIFHMCELWTLPKQLFQCTFFRVCN